MKRFFLALTLLFCSWNFYGQTTTNVFRHAINDEYWGVKLNYGFRALSRQQSIIDVGIDAVNNEFGTDIYDQYSLKSITDLKGIGIGIEYGSDNFFGEGQFDYAQRKSTYLSSLSFFFGYNFTFMERHPIAFRPAIGVNYNWQSTKLGDYPSADYDHNTIEVKQSNALAGFNPRLQLEMPVVKLKDESVIFLRGEIGYQFYAYTSRFIKLRSQRNYPNSKGNYTYDSDRFYLDGENSGYYLNGQHVNQPPTKMGGMYYSLEVAIKLKQ